MTRRIRVSLPFFLFCFQIFHESNSLFFSSFFLLLRVGFLLYLAAIDAAKRLYEKKQKEFNDKLSKMKINVKPLAEIIVKFKDSKDNQQAIEGEFPLPPPLFNDNNSK